MKLALFLALTFSAVSSFARDIHLYESDVLVKTDIESASLSYIGRSLRVVLTATATYPNGCMAALHSEQKFSKEVKDGVIAYTIYTVPNAKDIACTTEYNPTTVKISIVLNEITEEVMVNGIKAEMTK